MNEAETRAEFAGLATLQRGPSAGHAGLQPGSTALAGREPGGPPGEPSGEPSAQWSERGYMLHIDGQHLIQHVSYHLADSLPKEVVEEMDAEMKSLPDKLRDTEKEKRVSAYLDAGKGGCVLREPEIAEMVQNAFLIFHQERYVLHEWCVMPNHVHVLFQPINGWSMSKIVSSWKSFTGRRISEYKRATLERGEPTTGHAGLQPGSSTIWHREYWDRYIRDHAHYANVVNYIRMNPVKAGLVARPEDWKFSSAGYTAGLAGLQPGSSSPATLERGEPSSK